MRAARTDAEPCHPRPLSPARLWVREELERLGHLLEATLRRLAAGALVPVRVPLLGERLVCRAQLSLPHAPRHAEHLVRVAIVLVACRRGRGAAAAVARKPRRCRAADAVGQRFGAFAGLGGRCAHRHLRA